MSILCIMDNQWTVISLLDSLIAIRSGTVFHIEGLLLYYRLQTEVFCMKLIFIQYTMVFIFTIKISWKCIVC